MVGCCMSFLLQLPYTTIGGMPLTCLNCQNRPLRDVGLSARKSGLARRQNCRLGSSCLLFANAMWCSICYSRHAKIGDVIRMMIKRYSVMRWTVSAKVSKSIANNFTTMNRKNMCNKLVCRVSLAKIGWGLVFGILCSEGGCVCFVCRASL